MKTYIYPQNLKAASRLWLWSIKDFLIICIGLIRMEETTIMDYIFCAFKFFVTSQQLFYWR